MSEVFAKFDSNFDAEITRVACGMQFFQLIGSYLYFARRVAVKREFRRKNIGTILVLKEVEECLRLRCDEVFLETEVNNVNALRLYQKLGFYRHARLKKYYQNGNDAYRLKLWLSPPPCILPALASHKPSGSHLMQYNDSLAFHRLLQNLLSTTSGGFESGNYVRRTPHYTFIESARSDADSSSNTAVKSARKPSLFTAEGEFDDSWFRLPIDLQDLLKKP